MGVQKAVIIFKSRPRCQIPVTNLQHPPKSPNQDLKDMDVLCAFKIKIETQIWKRGLPKTSDHIRIKIKIWTPSQEPPVSCIARNQDLHGHRCTFKIKSQRQHWEYKCIKDQWPYSNQYQDAKPQPGTSSIPQSPKWGLKGHGCSLHLQNQEREPKFGSWIY